MKKLLLVLSALMICASLQAQDLIYYQDSSATDTLKLVPVSADTPLPIEGNLTIASATFESNITPVTDWATQTVTLVANTAQTIATALSSTNRRFIELKSHDPTKVFWIDYGADAVINASRPCDGYVYLELPIGIDLSVIASEAYDIAVTEGGDSL